MLWELGIEGWDIVGFVPRTIGIGLSNVSVGYSTGKTWGGGVGGNIIGVHVILKKVVSAINQVSDEFLIKYVEENIYKFATQEESGTLMNIQLGTIASVLNLETDIDLDKPNTAIIKPETKDELPKDPVKVCPKCGLTMSVKVAKSGDRKGQSFFVCPNYSQCKQVFPVDHQ